MVLAAGGVKVAKHGNRAASSLCGTADCLEALGINIQQDPQLALKMLEETNFCFLFAQKYHAAMKYVGPIRKELGFRTVFNILGPLTNPAKPEMFLLGVYDGYLVARNAVEVIECNGYLYDTMLSYVRSIEAQGRMIEFENQGWITLIGEGNIDED